MRTLRISFTTSETDAGPLLADLAGKVHTLDFGVIETAAPWKVSENSHTGIRSKITEFFVPVLAELKKNNRRLDTQTVKKTLTAKKLSASSFSHAITLLKNARMIRQTSIRGEYEVL